MAAVDLLERLARDRTHHVRHLDQLGDVVQEDDQQHNGDDAERACHRDRDPRHELAAVLGATDRAQDQQRETERAHVGPDGHLGQPVAEERS